MRAGVSSGRAALRCHNASMNRLARERSPYLLQHAQNPVDWFSWNDEAFARARAEGKPIFLSIGYSTCHWCHVMEHESFENDSVAAVLNEHFVSIKVDREERPDIDAVYMSAVQSLTGSGGWPMSVWLTPARAPFFGGTYFPPRDGVRGARRGFLTLLTELAASFRVDLVEPNVRQSGKFLARKLLIRIFVPLRNHLRSNEHARTGQGQQMFLLFRFRGLHFPGGLTVFLSERDQSGFGIGSEIENAKVAVQDR